MVVWLPLLYIHVVMSQPSIVVCCIFHVVVLCDHLFGQIHAHIKKTRNLVGESEFVGLGGVGGRMGGAKKKRLKLRW